MTVDALEAQWGVSYDRLVEWDAALSALTAEIAWAVVQSPRASGNLW
jgi:hypothetical protein